MKKALAILTALAVVGGAAFAEVNVGGWGRIGYIPYTSVDGADAFTDAYPRWADGGRVGVNFSGSSDNVGFNLNLDSNGNAFGVGDQAKIWVKVNSMFGFQVGKIQQDVLRGKIGDFGAFELESAGGEDDIFARFNPQTGLIVDITPMDGVYIGAAMDATGPKGYDDAGKTLTEDAVKAIQLGAGYVIADIGHLRAQYLGSAADDSSMVQVAFALTAVENLLVDAGAKIALGEAKDTSIAAGLKYSGVENLGLTARTKVVLGDDLGLVVAGQAEYTVAAPLAVGAEGGFNNGSGGDSNTDIGVYGKLGYSNGYGKFGFTYKTLSKTMALPIFAEYWF